VEIVDVHAATASFQRGAAFHPDRVGRLADDVGMRDVVAVTGVAGIGFTVSLFITELAFEPRSSSTDAAEGGRAHHLGSRDDGGRLAVLPPCRGRLRDAVVP